MTFELSTANVEGGFGPSHQLYCGRGEWRSADIVLVHFAEIASNGNSGRMLIEQLMGLPHKPLVVMIKHCGLAQLEMILDGRRPPNSTSSLHRSLWCRRDKHCSKLPANSLKAEADPMLKALLLRQVRYAAEQMIFEEMDGKLGKEMNVTFVDSCALLHEQLLVVDGSITASPSCASALPISTWQSQAAHSSFSKLATRMFPYNTKNGLGDPLHPTSSYSDLQGCAAAQLISMATARVKAAAPAAARGGPASRRGSSGAGGLHARGAGAGAGHRAGAVSKPSEPWCLRAGDDDFTRAIIFNDGWEVKTGGAGGNKRWLHATQLGAAVLCSSPSQRRGCPSSITSTTIYRSAS